MTRTATKKDKPMTFDKFVAALSKYVDPTHTDVIKVGQQNRTGTFYTCFLYQKDTHGLCTVNQFIRDSYTIFTNGWNRKPLSLSISDAYAHYALQISNGFESEQS